MTLRHPPQTSAGALFGTLALMLLLLLTSGCTSTRQPAFPGELQLIIAQNAPGEGSQIQQPDAAAPSGISVAELMQSVHSRSNDKNPLSGNTSADNASAHQAPSDWRGLQLARAAGTMAAKTSTSTDTSISTTSPPTTAKPNANQQQWYLDYPPGQALPDPTQLSLMKQLAAQQQLVLVGLKIGPVSGESPFTSAGTARQRATDLLLAFKKNTFEGNSGGRGTPDIEYRPTLNADRVLVTFARRKP